MSHFLARDVADRDQPLRRPHIAARVRVEEQRRIMRLTNDPLVVTAGTLVVELPNDASAVRSSGEIV